MKPSAWFVTILIFSAVPVHAAGCAPKADFRSDKKSGILVQAIAITGTTTLDSNETADISRNLTGSCFDENTDELEERVRAQFQNRGFFTSIVSGLHIKTIDPLESPKPVSVAVEVQEGLRYRLSALRFTNNRAFSSSQLRAVFPIRIRARVERNKIATRLDSLRELYRTKGYIDMISMPNTTLSAGGTVALIVDIDEGKQYHMGKIRITGKKEITESLQAQWSLQEGAVFDETYLGKFVDENHAILGENFDPSTGVQVVRNCRDNTVEMSVLLPGSQEALSGQAAKDENCDETAEEPRN
jgi:outer membrane protein assembly factor BamA